MGTSTREISKSSLIFILSSNGGPSLKQQHDLGLFSDAPKSEYEAAERWCARYPPQPPRLLPSDVVDRIKHVGCRVWGLELPPVDYTGQRFHGSIHNLSGNSEKAKGRAVVLVKTTKACKDVTLLSNLPIAAGLYDIRGKQGVYFELEVKRMQGFIAIGTACRPYPSWRLPGWNRLSAGLHLDDFRKFFEDPNGGRDYLPSSQRPVLVPGDTIGCAYTFSSGTTFFTYNGQRLPDAFNGIYLPRRNHDVYAAVGVERECTFEVNFGGEPFRWAEGNEWAWRPEGHVGVMAVGQGNTDDEDVLPTYEDAVR